jgi:hypothetical protein
MVRCNNARTRAAAESIRNTPARARFSKPTTSSSSINVNHTGGRGRNGGRGQSNAGTSRSGTVTECSKVQQQQSQHSSMG